MGMGEEAYCSFNTETVSESFRLVKPPARDARSRSLSLDGAVAWQPRDGEVAA